MSGNVHWHRVIYIEEMDVADCRMKGIILGYMIFESVESNIKGIWSCIAYLRTWIEIFEIMDI